MGSPGHNDLAFNDAGAPVPTTGFEYPDEDTHDGGESGLSTADAARLQILEAIVATAMQGRDATAIGRRMLLLHDIAAARPTALTELAPRAGCTPAALCTLKQRLSEVFRYEVLRRSRAGRC